LAERIIYVIIGLQLVTNCNLLPSSSLLVNMSLLKDDPIKFMDMLSDDGVFILDGAFGTVINQINNKEENSIQDPLWGSR
jgi:hypothetical protein